MSYDKIVITNLPAFYKINLFNRISESIKILVIFTGNDAEIRNRDFFSGEMKFDFQYLTVGSSLSKTAQIITILSKNKYKKLLIGGWDEMVLWAAAFFSSAYKNELILESSYLESKTHGPKKIIKQIFLSRISTVYASGLSQIKLLDMLSYKGNVLRTGGVGIFNVKPQTAYTEKQSITNFLYVGRFSQEKNLHFIVRYFNKHPELTLNLVGYGPEEKDLQAISAPNIVFHGQVQNADLHSYYSKNDVLLLASLHEVWGLVIEEALNNGLPVLVSKCVGSSQEWKEQDVAELFDPYDEVSLDNAVKTICQVEIYNRLSRNVSQMDFKKIADRQVQVYIN